jgi:hypothetical protein
MRSVAVAFLGLILAGVGIEPAAAEAWLRVGVADGRFLLEMPVPFDHPEPEVDADGAVISAYVHAMPGLALRFEVVDLVPPAAPDLLGNTERDPAQAFASAVLVSRSDYRLGPVQEGAAVLQLEDGARVHQERLYRVGNRLYRLIAVSTPEREDDPLIHRFLNSVRLLP